MTFPAFNWWAGNLRPHESVISLLLRFCELNCVGVRKGADLLRLYQNSVAKSSDDEVVRLAELLGEPLECVRETIFPNLDLDDCGSYSLKKIDRLPRSVLYCPECARLGYHSVFHEVRWLARCPFHAIELKVHEPPRRYGTILESRIGALRDLMRNCCRRWPDNKRIYIDECGMEIVEEIQAWIERVRGAANRFSEGEIWLCDMFDFYRPTPDAQVLGQLRALEPIPNSLDKYIKRENVDWRFEIKKFDNCLGDFLGNSRGRFIFNVLIDFYSRMEVMSSNPPSFVQRLDCAIKSLRGRHSVCRCRWLRVEISTSRYKWRTRLAGERPGIKEMCPFEVAIQELEDRWGRWSLNMSLRSTATEIGRLQALALDVGDAGFIQIATDRTTSTIENLRRLCAPLAHYAWSVSPNAHDLLNTAVEWHIDAAVTSLNTWLNQVSEGVLPWEWSEPVNCVRLRQIGGGLSLVRWRRG